MKYILVTGGCGYIGSHIVVELLETKENVNNIIILDNLCNSKRDVLEKIKKITSKKVIFFNIDLLNLEKLRLIFDTYKIDSVIHCAGLKSVKESIDYPIRYYSNNLISTLNLLTVMEENDCKKIIFSSSATVYGEKTISPITEDIETGKNITNPYGKSKYMIEEILLSLNESWNVVILRYFNPIGSHPSGLLIENPNNTPNNLFPYLLKVAKGEYKQLKIFGNNYNTKDGTCIRDFIHVIDLSNAHVKSLKKLNENGKFIYNVGTGIGISVLELIQTFEKANNISLNYIFSERRNGDVECLFSSNEKIQSDLNWKPYYTLENMCKDCVLNNLV